MQSKGWYQVAFERDLTEELTPTRVLNTPLVIVRSSTDVRIFDAICPHRGAHLGYGGRIDRNAIICPFHGYRIGLRGPGDNTFRVREYESLLVGGLVFVNVHDGPDNGFRSFLQR